MATTSKRVKAVYIAGNSFSGSTLLGIVLGSDPKAFFGGEINQLNRINKNIPVHSDDQSLFSGIEDGAYMYFVHSFYTIPADPAIVLTTTRYGDIEFCSSLRSDNVFACQFHPERSGVDGLRMYENIKTTLMA